MSGELCRLCLTSDTHRLNIMGTVLQDVYEKIADVNLNSIPELQFVCYICYARLRRCYSLMQQAVFTEKILKEAVANGIQLKNLANTQECRLHTSSVVNISLAPSQMVEIKQEQREDCLKVENIKSEPDPYTEHFPPLFASVAISNDSEEHLTEEADAGPSSEQAITILSGDLDYRSSDSTSRVNDNVDRYTNCGVELYNVFDKKVIPKRDASLRKTRNYKFAFKNMSYESKSQKKVPTKEKKMYICDICRVTYKKRSLFVKHIRSHEIVNRYVCEICGFKCKYTDILTRHMRKHTGEKPFFCNLCEYKSAQKRELVVHMRKHGEKPFSCKLCGFKTVHSGHLGVHMRLHTGEKPYSCTLCEYKCARNSRLVEHMRLHTGEKPYSCELCEFKAARRNALVVHMRSHTGEKPYSCELCEFKTAHRGHLKIHMRQHTGEKPYLCKLCEYKAASRSYLIVHMKTHRHN